jgi:CubicO group peptidase (beta-lactamase class C family)
MQKLACLLAVVLLSGISPQPSVQHDIPAVDSAVTKDDRLVYAKSYGQVSYTDHTPVTNSSLFRLASVSKQLTSVGIMKLLEAGKLTLDTRVFGPGSVFGTPIRRNTSMA